ncbi:hypothetical protein P171DRAFT_246600 [Karstenula rhodostoma CBS 690.94]|uniref:Secreted protein n=1 Tax=Karstenula rhodostoma CBS 690.94 TaxID=1392251 RepID=A0A9P4PND9_9PLEO|nr:hypothetical protein P171DRAFT_246600 [Karstenula rhodostoma CBS 690.94]
MEMCSCLFILVLVSAHLGADIRTPFLCNPSNPPLIASALALPSSQADRDPSYRIRAFRKQRLNQKSPSCWIYERQVHVQ